MTLFTIWKFYFLQLIKTITSRKNYKYRIINAAKIKIFKIRWHYTNSLITRWLPNYLLVGVREYKPNRTFFSTYTLNHLILHLSVRTGAMPRSERISIEIKKKECLRKIEEMNLTIYSGALHMYIGRNGSSR